MDNEYCKLLSICIPTYNRINNIKFTLEFIAKQIVLLDNSNEVELLVSDNASNDGTQDYLKYIKEKYSFISFNFFKQNFGWGGQVNYFIKNATGKYLIILSDDDVYSESMVKDLLANIKKHVDAEYFFMPTTSSKYDLKIDVKYNRQDFIKTIKMGFAALPSNIFLLNKIKNNKITSLIWPHCELLFNCEINSIYIINPMFDVYYAPSNDLSWWHNNPDRVMEYDVEIIDLILISKLTEIEKSVLINYYKKIMLNETIDYICCDKFDIDNANNYIELLKDSFKIETAILKLSRFIIFKTIIRIIFYIRVFYKKLISIIIFIKHSIVKFK